MTGVPGPWEFALLAAAAWRTWMLLAHDEILDPLRDRVFVKDVPPVIEPPMVIDIGPVVRYRRLVEFIECPYCLGFWVALAWWAAWTATGWTLTAAAPLALSAGLALADHAADALRASGE